MNKTLFSIIIPVYNTKISFLKDCFESIKQQSYTNYEVIIIDDGSNQETKNFLKNYESKYKIIHQPVNKGIVIGRKTGISNASGDYVIFLDSDDILNNKALEKLNNIITSNSPDVILFETPRFTNSILECKPYDDFLFEEGQTSKEKVMKELLSLHINGIADKVARRELLDFSKDNLDESIINGEDLQQSTALILKSDSFYYTHEEICYYRVNIQGRTYYDVTKISDINYMVPPYRMVFEKQNSYNQYLPEYKRACINSIIYNVFCIYEARLPKKETCSLLDKINNLEITKIMANIKEKINFPSEFVFSLLRNRHYFLLSILAKIYPLQH